MNPKHTETVPVPTGSQHGHEQPLPQKFETTPGGAEMMSQGLVDILMRVADRRPRDEKKFIVDALAELENVPEEAHLAFYSIPYRERSGDETGKTTMIEGPSIHASLPLARRWGNNVSGCRQVGETDTHWNLEGYSFDAETGFVYIRPFQQSKMYKVAGRFVEAGADRKMMLYQSAVSKAIRNAQLGMIPKFYTAAYVAKAKAIVAGKWDTKTNPKAVEGLLRSFAAMGVPQEMLERSADKHISEWTGDDVATLRGLFNAIQDGQVTLDEAFGSGEAEAPPDPQTKAQVAQEKAATTQSPTPPKPPTEPKQEKAGAVKPTDVASDFKIKQVHKILSTHGIELKLLPENPTESEAMEIINAGSKKTKTLEVLEQIRKVRETKQ